MLVCIVYSIYNVQYKPPEIVELNRGHTDLSHPKIYLIGPPFFIAASDSDAPVMLPPTIIMFLKTSCQTSEDCTTDCRATFKPRIWQEAGLNENEINQDLAGGGNAKNHVPSPLSSSSLLRVNGDGTSRAYTQHENAWFFSSRVFAVDKSRSRSC